MKSVKSMKSLLGDLAAESQGAAAHAPGSQVAESHDAEGVTVNDMNGVNGMNVFGNFALESHETESHAVESHAVVSHEVESHAAEFLETELQAEGGRTWR